MHGRHRRIWGTGCSIAGGEPLIHKEMPEIVRGFIQRKKFVYLMHERLTPFSMHG